MEVGQKVDYLWKNYKVVLVGRGAEEERKEPANTIKQTEEGVEEVGINSYGSSVE